MKNLMRAFAGESQARNRYTFAAAAARKQQLPCLQAVFLYTAGQEKEHAEIFYKHLQQAVSENVEISGGYPVDLQTDALALLQAAQHNEQQEYADVYPSFAKTAREEGFAPIARSFELIAEIEKTHGDRFSQLHKLLAEKKLFVSDVSTGWVCLNCGYTLQALQAPQACPVCDHAQGYFVRASFAPYSV